uniref:Uncharacterized protein n=1 Tax=Anguilla anguilla TaxID=7936 RepID=A0A0E9RNJ4_ANGAN
MSLKEREDCAPCTARVSCVSAHVMSCAAFVCSDLHVFIIICINSGWSSLAC